ncbi:MAG: IS3 family transposase [Fimbriimonadaceae bacterium]|nr:IS3 family transposase [Fimbriimonadaceae bacterium]
MTAHPELAVERCCWLLGVSRGSYYYQGGELAGRELGDSLLREEIERLLLDFPGYGYRRVTAQLRRQGWGINHKRVQRIMRQSGLQCRPRRRWVRTTNSAHGLHVWPNLLPANPPRALNQVWVADITYIRLPREFCYLAAVLDAYSRRVIGWELSRNTDARLPLAALERALLARRPAAGFIHHSDRGVQYACGDYVERLLAAGAQISMSGKGRPRDNARAESFFRTLKVEEVYLQEYQDIDEAEADLARFIDDVYNQKRLHSSLGYVPPCEFEEALAVRSVGP